MTPQKNLEKKVLNERKQILEMIDASIALSIKKGPHPLKNGCRCIACENKRKLILYPPKPWRFRL